VRKIFQITATMAVGLHFAFVFSASPCGLPTAAGLLALAFGCLCASAGPNGLLVSTLYAIWKVQLCTIRNATAVGCPIGGAIFPSSE
jgi:hypothetical protein